MGSSNLFLAHYGILVPAPCFLPRRKPAFAWTRPKLSGRQSTVVWMHRQFGQVLNWFTNQRASMNSNVSLTRNSHTSSSPRATLVMVLAPAQRDDGQEKWHLRPSALNPCLIHVSIDGVCTESTENRGQEEKKKQRSQARAPWHSGNSGNSGNVGGRHPSYD